MPENTPDPLLEQVLREHRAMSRRGFLGRAAGATLAASGLASALAACGGVAGENPNAGKTTATTEPAKASHPKTTIDRLVFANWPLYIDKKVLRQWEKQTGGDVRYTEEINDNYEFFGKVRQQLTRGQPIDRDIVVLTDYMAARWVRNGYCEPIDKANVPNMANLAANLKSINYDPERTFTLPWQSGATGIGYNRKKTGRELKSVNDLFDPAFKGRVSFLQEPYDSAGLVLLGMGVDPSKAPLDDMLRGIEKIEEENRKGQIRRFTGNDYTTDLTKGNLWACVAYSGDLVQLQADNPDLEFVFPEEGAMLFTDNMIMPKGVEHPYAAETMMNFVYEPEVAATIAEYVSYITPVDGVRDILASRGSKLAESELVFPSDEVRSRLKPYPALSPSDERAMQEAMAQVTGA